MSVDDELLARARDMAGDPFMARARAEFHARRRSAGRDGGEVACEECREAGATAAESRKLHSGRAGDLPVMRGPLSRPAPGWQGEIVR